MQITFFPSVWVRLVVSPLQKCSLEQQIDNNKSFMSTADHLLFHIIRRGCWYVVKSAQLFLSARVSRVRIASSLSGQFAQRLLKLPIPFFFLYSPLFGSRARNDTSSDFDISRATNKEKNVRPIYVFQREPVSC